MRKVLDSWAVMAFLKGEQPGRQEVRKLLEEATTGKLRLLMSMINVGEIFYSLAKQQGHHYAEQFLSDLPGLPVETLVPSRNLILDAARWKAKAPISYADAFAVATAIEQEAELVTGDPELKRFRGQFVDWIGR